MSRAHRPAAPLPRRAPPRLTHPPTRRYVAAYCGPRRPVLDQQDALLYPEDAEGGPSAPSLLDGFSKFVKGFQAL